MHTFETSGTVDQHGELHVAGLPFAAGTPVEIVVIPKPEAATTQADNRLARLLAALDKAHNVQPLGSFKREELYDRNVLH